MKRLQNSLIGLFLVALVLQTAAANMYDELSRTCADPLRLSMILWMPIEMFAAMEDQLPKGALDEMKEILKGHSMIAAVDGRISPLGRTVFQSEADVRKDLAIIRNDKIYEAILTEETPDALRYLQDAMQQAWAAIMGEMGRNMRLYLFPVELDASSQGEFTVRLGGSSSKEELFVYETPLRAVVPDTPCPACGYSVRAAWNYCPRCANPQVGNTEAVE